MGEVKFENLKGLLEKPKPSDFDEIAKILLTKTKIVKGTREYYITDIEFYLYCDGHEDIITYPRSCEAGDWFFHDSGVDISFASNVEFENGKAKLQFDSNVEFQNGKAKKPDNNSFFGGILLRGIKMFDKENKTLSNNGVNGVNLNDKPSNVFYELFRNFDAFCGNVEFPKLVSCENGQKFSPENSTIRKNIVKDCGTEDKLKNLEKSNKLNELIKNKLYYISSNYNGNKDDFINTFKDVFGDFVKAKYRYKAK